MKLQLRRLFLVSAGTLFFITGIAKLLSAIGTAQILNVQDPLLGISFRLLFIIAGILELSISLACLFGKSTLLEVQLVVWLSTCILIYRAGLSLTEGPAPCSCLGYFTEAIYLRPELANLLMKIILGYLFVGSILVWLLSKKGATSKAYSPQL